MGALARAAFGREQIPPAVHRHRGPVDQEGVVGGHPLGDLSVDRQLLQVFFAPKPGRPPLQLILPSGLGPLIVDVRRRGPHDEVRLALRPVGGAAGMDPL